MFKNYLLTTYRNIVRRIGFTALITVSYHAISASTTNPVKSLRYE